MDHEKSQIAHQGLREYSPRYLKVSVVLLIVSILLLFVQLVLWIFSTPAEQSGEQLPISIRSSSQADYERDLNDFFIAPVSLDILNQIITDMPATGAPQDRIATMQAGLSTLIVTSTPSAQFHGTSTPASPATSTTRVTPTPTVASASTTVSTSAATVTTPPLLPTLSPLLTTNLPLPTSPPMPTVPLTVPTLLPTSLPLPTLPLLP